MDDKWSSATFTDLIGTAGKPAWDKWKAVRKAADPLSHLAPCVTQTRRLQNVPQNAGSITIHAAPSFPTLHRFLVPSLPIPRQITLGFFPPLHDLFAAPSPVKSSRLWVQTLLPKDIYHVLCFRVPVLLRSFLGREGKE